MKKFNVVTLTVIFLSIAFFNENVFGAARTWDGGGATNNWSEAANWSGDSVPNPALGDEANFDGTSVKNCLIDINVVNLGFIRLNAGYTGTVSMALGINASFQNFVLNSGQFTAGDGAFSVLPFTLTINGGTLNAGTGIFNFETIVMSGGTFNGASGDVSGGLLQMSSGTFNAPTGNLDLTSNLTVNGGTFNHNGGTIRFLGNSNAALSVITANNLVINKSGNAGVSALGTIVVTGTLTLTDGLINSGTLRAENAVNIASTFGDQINGGGAGDLLIQNGAGPRTITFPAGVGLPTVRINDANVTVNSSGSGTILCDDFILDAGLVNIGSNNWTNGFGPGSFAAFTINGGTFTVGSGNFTMNTFSDFILNNGVFNGGTGNFSTEGAVSLNGGTFNASTGNTTVKRGLTILSAAGFNHNNGTVTLASNGISFAFTLNSTVVNFHNLTLDMNGFFVTISVASPIVNGTFRQISGSTNAGQVQVKGNMLMETGASGGATDILFNGTGNQTFTNNSPNNFSGTWTVNKPSGVLSLASNLTLSNSQTLSITSGEFSQGASFNLSVGAVNVAVGGFWRNNGTGDITLGGNVTNAGEIDIDGTTTGCNESDTAQIRSSTAGVQRNWTGTGSFFVQDADVQDQAGTAVITSFAGFDAGNNGANWTFNSACAPFVWDGGGATNNWSEAANWRRNILPISTTLIIFDSTSVKNAVVDTPFSVDGIQINSSYTGTISWANNGNLLTVGSLGIIQNGGSFQSGRLTVNGNINISNAVFQVIFASLLDINGNLSVSNSNFAFAPNAQTTLSGNFTLVSPTAFDAGASLILDSNTTSTLNVPNNTQFNQLTINKTSNASVDISPASNLIVNQPLTLLDGQLNGSSIEARHQISVSSGFDGGNGSIIIQNALAFTGGTISSGAVLPDSFTLNSADYQLGIANLAGVVTFQNFNLQNGRVSASSTLASTALFNGNFNQTGGEFFYGNAGQTVAFNGSFSLSGGHFRSLSSQTVDLNGEANLSGGTFTSTSGNLQIGNNFTRSAGNTFNHNNGSVIFDGAVDSNITLPDSPNTTVFNNLRFDSPNSKTIASSVSTFTPFIVNGLLEFNNGFILTSPSQSVIEARGNVTIGNGLDNGFATSIRFGGSIDQNYVHLGGNESFNWIVDKSAGTVNIATDFDISDTITNQTLNLVNGTITTGNNKVIIGAEDSLTRTNGFVIGNLQQNFNTPTAKTFHVGTANEYSPVLVNATNVNGNSSLTISATDSIRAGMNVNHSANRFWTLTESGDLTADLTFNYLQSDVIGLETSYQLYKWNGTTPTFIPGTLDINANTIAATGISDFSDWAIGNLAPTAANVEISGQVLTANGRAIPNATLILSGGNLPQPIYARTNPFGYYRFLNVPVGDYIITISAKQYVFNPSSVFVSATDNIENLNFYAQSDKFNPGDKEISNTESGGGKTSGGTFTLDSTIGQPVSGGLSNGGSFSVVSGFWAATTQIVPPQRAPFDFDGDGKADIAVFRPSVGQWWYLRSSDGGNRAYQFGLSTDKPVVGDYTGDGKSDIAFWRSSDGFWYILRSEDDSFFSFPFGTSGDIPAPGDYDGDGKTDPTVFRPSSATWFVNRSTAGLLIVNFGFSEDRPVPSAFVP